MIMIFLSEYDNYIKGEDNDVADALSGMECVKEGHVVPTFPQVVDTVIAQPPVCQFSPHDSDIERAILGNNAFNPS
jgi:hypothetical protein